jgi:NitT/TauT family transport system substrate-binding protein
MHFKTFIALCLLSLILAGCAAPTAQPIAPAASEPAPPLPEPIKVRLPMGYIPSVQYAPFYMAVEKGYFAEAGIEIEFDYAFETDGVTLVGADNLQFALVSGEQVLLARAQGLPVVYIFGWWQDYPVAVAAKKEAGIRAPTDLAGKRIGLPGLFGASYVGLRALLSSAGIAENQVTLDSIGFNQVEALLAGQEQAVVVYANNEPLQLRARGIEIDVINVADHVHLASNGLISNETTLAGNPELARRMTQALRRGLQDVLADPGEAYQICLKYVENLGQQDETLQRDILATSISFWQAEKLGYSDPQAWENMQNVLIEMGLLSQPLDLSQAYTNQFVEP